VVRLCSLSLLLILPTCPGCSSVRPLPLDPPRNGGVYVVAHRGAHQGIPENTIPAYRKAISLGVDFIEIDVRTTRDGRFVSVHDSAIDAYVPGVSGNVRNYTLEELQAFDVGSRLGPKWRGTHIPSLEEILDLCRGRCGVYLDLKEGEVGPLVEMVRVRGMEAHVLWYADQESLERLGELCPACLAMPDPGPEENLGRVLETLAPSVVATVWRHFSRSFVETCHAAGALVIVDERDPDCWRQALEWGADGIQTDHPERLIEFLRSAE